MLSHSVPVLWAVLALLGTSPQADEQPSPSLASVMPANVDVRRLADRRFDGSFGSHNSTMRALAVNAVGHSWLPAEDGHYVRADGTWRLE